MGLLQQNMNKYMKLYLETRGILRREDFIKWFGNKRAIKRDSINTVVFDKKTAVVIVGTSGTGKTTYAKRFLENHPDFVFCSHDECFFEAMSETKNDGEVEEGIMMKILEKKLRNANRNQKNCIFDGLLVNPANRAALLNTLSAFGYEIHIVFFTEKYVKENIEKCILRRAVELSLYERYIDENKDTMSFKEIVKSRENIINIYSKKLGISAEEVYEMFANCAETISHSKELVQAYEKEAIENGVVAQERYGYFYLGTDYYYDL